MGNKNPEIVKATTEDIRRIGEPYQGKREYGNLRLAWPGVRFHGDDGPFSWLYVFENMAFSSDKSNIWLAYNPSTNEWGRGFEYRLDKGSFEKPYASREMGLRGIRRKIKGIPKNRMGAVEKFGWEIIENMAKQVGKKLENCYAPWELEYKEDDHDGNVRILEGHLMLNP